MNTVCIGILKYDGKFLIARRHEKCNHYPNCWEFPGGKKLDHESDIQALNREWQEELSIIVLNAEEFYVTRWEKDNETILKFFIITEFRGNPRLNEHGAVAWEPFPHILNYAGKVIFVDNYPGLITALMQKSDWPCKKIL